MQQHSSFQNNRRIPNRKSQKYKRQALQRMLLLFLIIFTFGFLLGFWIGTRQEREINFVMPAPTATENRSATQNKIPKNLPWNLTLVNFEHALDESFEPSELAEVDNGYVADNRIADAVKKMIADARTNDGVRIIALSAYRDFEYQKELYENKVQRLQQEKGYSVDKVREEAATVVAYPGTSEHQLGLALDLVDARHVKLDESQENTAAYKWLYQHCAEYGFIVRYPNGKTDITGIIYEPWHFRYVGVEAAKIIMEKGITLEEYLLDYYEP